MKADLFLLTAAACVAGVFVYAFLGGLVVRLWNALPNTEDIDATETSHAAFWWPIMLIVIAGLAIGQLCHLALRLSQWRPKPRPTLPGARVVR